MQLADSDAGLYALGVAAQSGLDVEVSLPDVHPMQVQGPLSGKTLEKLVGPAIYDIKYYWIEEFEIEGIPVVISRTGWTAIPGFEVNLLDDAQRGRAVGRRGRRRRGVRHPSDRAVRGTAYRGRHLQLRLGHPPGRHAVPRDGSRAPGRGSAAGLHRQGGPGGAAREAASIASSSASSWRATSCAPRCRSTGTSRTAASRSGHMTDAVWSPGLKKNIGYVWVPIELAEPGNRLDVETEDGDHIVGDDRVDPVRRPAQGAARRGPQELAVLSVLSGGSGGHARNEPARGGGEWPSERTIRRPSRRFIVIRKILPAVLLAIVTTACSVHFGSSDIAAERPAGEPAGFVHPPHRRRARRGASCATCSPPS